MKIFYAIQGTGNGHISRAIELYPYLQKYGQVDFMLSGSNANLPSSLPVKYKSKGLSLFYKHSGGLDYIKILRSLSLSVIKDAKTLPIEDYDLVINDFDFVTSLACKFKKIPCIHFGHQASFQSKKTPRPSKIDFIGNFILEKFVKSDTHIGLHFENYDHHIYNPIIKEDIIKATPINDGHITVYLPQYSIQHLEPHFLKQGKFHFEVFSKEIDRITCKNNITYFPINNEQFTSSLIRCYGIITAGGFETPAEAMYMNKKLLSIPILNHYEQACNAKALEKLGIMVLKKVDEKFGEYFSHWINEKKSIKLNLAHSTADIVEILMKNNQTKQTNKSKEHVYHS